MTRPAGPTASPELMRYLAELRSRVHRYRRYGLLPRGPQVLARTLPGSGLACAICGESVLAAEAEVLVECTAAAGGTGPVLRVHHLCHSIWVGESSPATPHPQRPTPDPRSTRRRG